MPVLTIVLFILGVGLLIVGAELLVRGATRIAAALGVSALVIGLTVVALGTSAPELAVSLQAALSGEGALTLGNVVGSNIANLLLILGIAGLIGALPVAPQILRRDGPAMGMAAAAVLLMSLDGQIGRLDGALLMAGLVAYFVMTVRGARSSAAGDEALAAEREARRAGPAALALNLLFVLLGLALLIVGANWLVDGATTFASALGVSELVIGLTVVAVGTSLPEIATSVIAGLRGERDIAVGNVVGSNILNLLAVLGLTATISSTPIPVPASAMQLDMPLMAVITLLVWPIFYTRSAVTRYEAGLLLGVYLAYTVYLVLAATASSALRTYGLIALVAAPVLITVIVIRAVRFYAQQVGRRRSAGQPAP